MSRQEFDCVVSGCWMPGMGGLALLRHIRMDARLRHLPVLMMTNRASNQPCDHCVLHAGASACIVKPFTAEALRQKMDDMLGRRHGFGAI